MSASPSPPDASPAASLRRRWQLTPDATGRGPIRRTATWDRGVRYVKASHPALAGKLIATSGRVQRALKPLELARDLPASTWTGLLHRADFRHVERYVLFVGYSRSGHSLVGSLLNAHPNMVLGQGLNALRYVAAGFRRTQIYGLIIRADQRYERRGRTSYKGKYNYRVEGQWQGRYTTLRMIGNKRGEPTARMLEQQPELLDRLRRLVGVPVHVVHVIRNPFDNITAIARGRMSLEDAADRYFRRCRTIDRLRQQAPAGQWFDLRHEDLVTDPRASLRALCEYLGAEVDDSYIEACASIIYDNPHRARSEAAWTPELIADVTARMEPFRFLDSYGYEEPAATR